MNQPNGEHGLRQISRLLIRRIRNNKLQKLLGLSGIENAEMDL